MADRMSEERIGRIAHRAAENSGDPAPTGISYVRTTGDFANRLFRPPEAFDEPTDSGTNERWPRAVVIKVTGTFTAYRARLITNNTPLSTGNVIYTAYSDTSPPEFIAGLIGDVDRITPLERGGEVHVIAVES